jgi:hypothetical protein
MSRFPRTQFDVPDAAVDRNHLNEDGTISLPRILSPDFGDCHRWDLSGCPEWSPGQCYHDVDPTESAKGDARRHLSMKMLPAEIYHFHVSPRASS